MEAEAAVKKLSRLPENCICANCGTTSRYGFSSVCIKYLTFVCNLCKTAHQAVSHRCKSLSMSSWDQGEVLKLKKHGNDHARKVWLAMAPQPGVGGRPKEGDDVNVFKRFVVTVYENKKYFRELEDGGAEDNVVAASQTRAPVYMSSSSRHTRPAAVPKPVSPKRVPKRAPAPKPAPAPAIVVDLLDFGAFDSAPAPAPSQAAPTATEDFTNFSQGQSIPPVAQPPFDPFNNRAQQNSNNIPTLAKLAPAPVANDPFAPSSSKLMTNANASNDPFAQPSSASTSNVSFDPFNNNATGTNNAASNGNMNQAKAPVMNNNMNIMSGGNNSMMNNNRGGMNSGMMTNGGMMNNNTNMMMNGGMMNNNNNMMMNGGMMNNNMGFTPQQQMMMMQQQQQQQNSFGRMNGMEQNIMNGGMSSNTGMGGNAMNTARPMNINVMQPMNNRISNNFGSTPAADPNKKPDPFSELGF